MKVNQSPIAQFLHAPYRLFKFSLPLLMAAVVTMAPHVQASNTTTTSTPATSAASASITAHNQTAYRINAIQRDLTSIRQHALQTHPELVTQTKAFEAAYKKKATDVGYNPESFVNKAHELQSKVQDQALSEKERNALIKEFAAAKQELAKQRERILSDKQLIAMQTQLQNDTLAAMQAYDPKTETLITELAQLLKTKQISK
ncbi:hypothetical protein [Photobacterium nomapromontoriensis]|uniref:hypothetical protein n=1 Tax=Photobacterium nomapromontoriensis TaxID=2910237 RepID=UPI003D0AC135